MSVAKNGKATEPKEATASQLFDRYMKAVARAKKLTDKLTAEILEADSLSTELAARFGVHVGNKPPARKAHGSTRVQASPDDDDSRAEDKPVEFKPPAQHTAEAPRLSAKESQDVAEIRRDAGLNPEEQADAEALESGSGPSKMLELQHAMGGKPVIPSPGQVVAGVPQGEPDPGPDNQGGGTTEQKPLPEKE